MVRNDSHFFGKAFDMIGFFFKKRQWNEQGEVAIFNACRLDFGVHKFLDAFPHAIAPRPDDHASTNTGFLGQVGFRNDFLIPAREILRACDA